MVDRLDFDEIMRIQNLMASNIAKENKVNNKLLLIDIINQLMGKKKSVQVEEVIIEANYNNISEDEVLRLLDELNEDDVITLKNGRVKINY